MRHELYIRLGGSEDLAMHTQAPMAQDEARAWLDGAPVYTAHRAMLAYGLLSEFDNPQGFPSVKYYRLSERGRAFADRACDSWRRRPLLERLAVRLTG